MALLYESNEVSNKRVRAMFNFAEQILRSELNLAPVFNGDEDEMRSDDDDGGSLPQDDMVAFRYGSQIYRVCRRRVLVLLCLRAARSNERASVYGAVACCCRSMRMVVGCDGCLRKLIDDDRGRSRTESLTITPILPPPV